MTSYCVAIQMKHLKLYFNMILLIICFVHTVAFDSGLHPYHEPSPIKPYNVTVLLQGTFVLYVVLTLCLWTNFLWCDHSNETSSAVLWHYLSFNTLQKRNQAFFLYACKRVNLKKWGFTGSHMPRRY